MKFNLKPLHSQAFPPNRSRESQKRTRNDIRQKLPLSLLALVLVTALAAASCGSSNEQSESTPTQPAASATATATSEEDIDGVIRQLFWDYERVKDVTIDRKINYVDSSGTEWIRFDVHVPDDAVRAGVPPGAWEYGFMNKAPGGNWELVNLGTGNIQCGAPPDVQTGLGFTICPASEEELNNAIRDFVLGHSAPTVKATDVKISRKAYYTDSSGTEWAEFRILGIPNLTGPTYGFMKEVIEGSWEGVGGPGSYQVECGLPEDVQIGLGFPYCPPQSQ